MNSYLFLIKWLIEHTEITEDLTEVTVKDMKEDLLKEDLPEFVLNLSNLNMSIGYCLNLIYGADLKKSEGLPINYLNLKYSASKIRTVLIGGLDG